MLHELAKVLQIPLGGRIRCQHMQHIALAKTANRILNQHQRFRAAQSARVELCVVFHQASPVNQRKMLGHLGRDSHQVPNTKPDCPCDEWVHSAQSFCSIPTMSDTLHRPSPGYRPRTTHALLVGLVSWCLAAHASDPSPTPMDTPPSGPMDQGLLESCASADAPKQPMTGEAPDNVATQLLLTIERTEAPALRGKLIAAYRRYLGCPADREPPKTPAAP